MSHSLFKAFLCFRGKSVTHARTYFPNLKTLFDVDGSYFCPWLSHSKHFLSKLGHAVLLFTEKEGKLINTWGLVEAWVINDLSPRAFKKSSSSLISFLWKSTRCCDVEFRSLGLYIFVTCSSIHDNSFEKFYTTLHCHLVVLTKQFIIVSIRFKSFFFLKRIFMVL